MGNHLWIREDAIRIEELIIIHVVQNFDLELISKLEEKQRGVISHFEDTLDSLG